MKIGRRTASLVCIVICCGAFAPAAAGAPDARAIVARWRAAVHPAGTARPAGLVTFRGYTREAGLDGTVTFAVTPNGRFAQTDVSSGDTTEIVVDATTGWTKDWNGDVRVLQGEELKRTRTQAFVEQALFFGPPATLDGATLGTDPEKKYDVISHVVPGAASLMWFIDRATGFPAKVMRPTDDGNLTIVLDDWITSHGITYPAVSKETGGGHRSPLLTTATAVTFSAQYDESAFARPSPGPSDTHFSAGAMALGIPFNFEKAHIMISGDLNGRGPLWWLLDTGAGQNIVNADRLASFGLVSYGTSSATGGGGTSDYAFAKGATITFPGVVQRDQRVGVLGIGGLERIYGMEMAGLLGYDFISRFVEVFDYEKKTMDLYDPKTFHYNGPGVVLPFTIENNLLYTNGTISVPNQPNIAARFLIDSGAADTMNLTSPFVRTHHLAEVAQTGTGVNRTPGAADFYTQTNVRGLLQQVNLGGITLTNVPVNFSVSTTGAYSSSDFAGTIGQGIWHRYKVIFDYSRHHMILEPTAQTTAPFPERRSFGMTLLSSGPHLKTFTITAVRAGSPADKAGFRANDIIAAVDGKAAADLTLGEVRDDITHDGQHFAFTVTRGSENVNIATTITLYSLDRTP
jgi:hypothetical protein